MDDKVTGLTSEEIRALTKNTKQSKLQEYKNTKDLARRITRLQQQSSRDETTSENNKEKKRKYAEETGEKRKRRRKVTVQSSDKSKSKTQLSMSTMEKTEKKEKVTYLNPEGDILVTSENGDSELLFAHKEVKPKIQLVKHKKEVILKMIEALPQEYHEGVPYEEEEEEEEDTRPLTEKELAQLCPEARLHSFSSNEEYFAVRDQLKKYFNREMVPTVGDGNCFYRSLVNQIDYEKNGYTYKDLKLQTIFYALYNYDKFDDILVLDAEDRKEALVELLKRLLTNEVWGHTGLLSVVVRMFRIGISVVTPFHGKPIPFHHNHEDPHIVIAANGGNISVNNKQAATHFIATSKYIFMHE